MSRVTVRRAKKSVGRLGRLLVQSVRRGRAWEDAHRDQIRRSARVVMAALGRPAIASRPSFLVRLVLVFDRHARLCGHPAFARELAAAVWRSADADAPG